ncbi:Sua5/YciO/YrdC/YwlC family protein [Streptomyces sp. M19]
MFLPASGLHHLLLHDLARPLVVTSGNLADEPIAVDDAEARAFLGPWRTACSRTTAPFTPGTTTRSSRSWATRS